MKEISYYLHKVEVGDIIHAHGVSCMPSMTCLVIKISEGFIHVRDIPKQLCVSFDINTGKGFFEGDECVIDSIAPLPIDIHHVLIHLDRKYRLSNRDPDLPLDMNSDELHLTEAEKSAFSFIHDYYPSNNLKK